MHHTNNAAALSPLRRVPIMLVGNKNDLHMERYVLSNWNWIYLDWSSSEHCRVSVITCFLVLQSQIGYKTHTGLHAECIWTRLQRVSASSFSARSLSLCTSADCCLLYFESVLVVHFRVISCEEGKALAESWNAAFMESSAKENQVNKYLIHLFVAVTFDAHPTLGRVCSASLRWLNSPLGSLLVLKLVLCTDWLIGRLISEADFFQ